MIASPTFELFLATPIIITSEMDESTFRYEYERMRLRSDVTREFVAGRLDVSDYLEGLAEGGVDVDAAIDTWASGQSYMG
jgi:hypothetical protein